MNPAQLKLRDNPEKKIQEAIENMLRMKGWHVMRTHGNLFQSGFPDIFACHSRYGQRWIEVKLPGMKGSKFTPAQMEHFPKICANGSGVWVMTSTSEQEYIAVIKDKPNWWKFL